MAFDEVRLPDDISEGSQGGPAFSTVVVGTDGGAEQRVSRWAYGRLRWDVGYGVRTAAQMDAFIAFFRARRGRARGFRFKDWTDFEAVDSPMHVLTAHTAQLYKSYSSGGVTVERKIAKPVAGTVSIKLDGSAIEDWTIDAATGIATFVRALASEADLTASFEFDVPVRFDTDAPKFTAVDYVRSVDGIPIVEVLA